jgi:hypothetical protein
MLDDLARADLAERIVASQASGGDRNVCGFNYVLLNTLQTQKV